MGRHWNKPVESRFVTVPPLLRPSPMRPVVEVTILTPPPLSGVKRHQSCSSVEALQDIADAVKHLCSDERFAELEACVKALEEKYKVLAAAYEAEMAEKVMVEAEDVEMDRGSDDDEDATEGGE